MGISSADFLTVLAAHTATHHFDIATANLSDLHPLMLFADLVCYQGTSGDSVLFIKFCSDLIIVSF